MEYQIEGPLLKDKIWPAREVQTSTNVPGPVKIIMDWVCSYVMKPHPNLGRPGVVCPYVPPAMKLNSVWLAMVHTDLAAEADLYSIVEKYLRIYQSLDAGPGEGRELKSLILIFPDIPDHEACALIKDVHTKMKPQIVEAGLMLGEFFIGNDSPGLHNPQFHPLTSPFPLLIYRRMMMNDLVFLTKPSDPPESRAQFVRAYLRTFGDGLPADRQKEAEMALAAAGSMTAHATVSS